jgi:DNA-binding CsgD family transcriptional regulator
MQRDTVCRVTMDARRLMLAVDACHACTDLDAWPEVALAQLGQLVPCDFAAFNDFDPESDRYVAIVSSGAMPPGWDEVWAKFGLQNPAYRRVAEQGDVGPMRLSDFIDQPTLRSTELYRRLYGPMGVNYQIGMAIEAPRPQITALVLNREKRDFTRSDLETVRLMRPHLRRSYENARAHSGLRRDRDRLEHAVAAANVLVVELDSDGFVVDMTPRARSTLERHQLATDGTELMGELAAWVARTREGNAPAGTSLRTTAGVLGASIVPGPNGAVLLLEQTFDRNSTSLPLTAKERQVLETIAGGATNAQAAEELRVSARTIAKHLEHIYAKLGVPNRGTAVALYLARAARASRASQQGEIPTKRTGQAESRN